MTKNAQNSIVKKQPVFLKAGKKWWTSLILKKILIKTTMIPPKDQQKQRRQHALPTWEPQERSCMAACSLEGAVFLQAQSSSLIPRSLPRMKEDMSTQRPPWGVYNSFIYNCQNSETTQTYVIWWKGAPMVHSSGIRKKSFWHIF